MYEVEGNLGREEFERLFWLEEDLAGRLEKLVEGDEVWEGILGRQKGLRLMRPSCAVETMFSFLCTSNNHLLRIRPMVEKLASYGERRGFEGREWRRFPSLARIEEITEEELRAAGFGYRGKTIPLAAKELVVRGGEEYLEGLKGSGYEQAFGELKSLPGVGPKLADCICLFALGHGEAVPVDTHIWQQATARFFPQWRGLAVTENRYRAVGDYLRVKFGDLAGAAHQMMFHENLRGGKVKG